MRTQVLHRLVYMQSNNSFMPGILLSKSLDRILLKTSCWNHGCGRSNWPTSVEPQAYAKCTLRFCNKSPKPPLTIHLPLQASFWTVYFPLFRFVLKASIAEECTNAKVVPIRIFCESISCTYKTPKEETQSRKTLFLFSPT